ncbi:hypothetical protein B7C42_08280 [Nocardia cerradoensis]|nr:hypothetical protein B7C42_08280 [Nocardia cerradoensis]
MEKLLDAAQRDYDMPPGARWVPARLGGTAPTLEQAKVLEREEMERRAAAKARRAQG